MNRYIDFYVSGQCFNNCLYCSQADFVNKAGRDTLSFRAVIAVLKKKKARYNWLNLMGGEPTLAEDFGQIVRSARRLGYRISVGTGGGLFADREFSGKIVPLLDEVTFSLSGPSARVHDRLTRASGSFNRLMRAMENCLAYPKSFMVNVLMTKNNLSCLDGIFPLLAEKGVQRTLFCNLIPEGRALGGYGKLVPRYAEIKKLVPRWAALAARYRILLVFCDVPFCVLGDPLLDYSSRMKSGTHQERLSIKRVREKGVFVLKEEQPSFPDLSKMKTVKCRSCIHINACEGLHRAYYEKFSDREIRPFKK